MVHVTGSQRDELSKLSASQTLGTVAYIDCCLPRDRAFPKNAFPFRSRNFHYSLRLLSLTATSIARRVCRYRSPRMPLFLLSLADNHLRRLSLSLFLTHTHSLAPYTRPFCMDIRPRMSSSSHSSSESSLILSVHGFM